MWKHLTESRGLQILPRTIETELYAIYFFISVAPRTLIVQALRPVPISELKWKLQILHTVCRTA
jgi:hypothetical protein